MTSLSNLELQHESNLEKVDNLLNELTQENIENLFSIERIIIADAVRNEERYISQLTLMMEFDEKYGKLLHEAFPNYTDSRALINEGIFLDLKDKVVNWYKELPEEEKTNLKIDVGISVGSVIPYIGPLVATGGTIYYIKRMNDAYEEGHKFEAVLHGIAALFTAYQIDPLIGKFLGSIFKAVIDIITWPFKLIGKAAGAFNQGLVSVFTTTTKELAKQSAKGGTLFNNMIELGRMLGPSAAQETKQATQVMLKVLEQESKVANALFEALDLGKIPTEPLKQAEIIVTRLATATETEGVALMQILVSACEEAALINPQASEAILLQLKGLVELTTEEIKLFNQGQKAIEELPDLFSQLRKMTADNNSASAKLALEKYLQAEEYALELFDLYSTGPQRGLETIGDFRSFIQKNSPNLTESMIDDLVDLFQTARGGGDFKDILRMKFLGVSAEEFVQIEANLAKTFQVTPDELIKDVLNNIDAKKVIVAETEQALKTYATQQAVNIESVLNMPGAREEFKKEFFSQLKAVTNLEIVETPKALAAVDELKISFLSPEGSSVAVLGDVPATYQNYKNVYGSMVADEAELLKGYKQFLAENNLIKTLDLDQFLAEHLYPKNTSLTSILKDNQTISKLISEQETLISTGKSALDTVVGKFKSLLPEEVSIAGKIDAFRTAIDEYMAQKSFLATVYGRAGDLPDSYDYFIAKSAFKIMSGQFRNFLDNISSHDENMERDTLMITGLQDAFMGGGSRGELPDIDLSGSILFGL